MSGRIGIDCIASFVLRSVAFNCQRGYMHEGPHEAPLSGEEHRVTSYGHYESRDATTVLRWNKGRVSYAYTETRPSRPTDREEGT